MSEAILLQRSVGKNNRYLDWEEKEYEGTPYLEEPRNHWNVRNRHSQALSKRAISERAREHAQGGSRHIAYWLKDRYVELTWRRSVGKIGPHWDESIVNYVSRRLSERGRVEKRDIRNLAAVLTILEAQYGR